MKTTAATRKGDKWVIETAKSALHHQRRVRQLVHRLRQDQHKDAGHRGISCFKKLVPRDAGVVVDKHEDKMGQRASNTCR